ncbi:molecular chaperone DnaJ [Alteromonas ponticola]|uniref:Molecular chaperone DnaJ n=1 Tax=Alteromonas aquimaris TaxID=2998417 RepID=A0ABT3PBD9_9ALTE|nr:DNA-J related domain-containing protein [Alteromonas aquimaris]MCW8109890.1 molecular chaperone DnaJ [Alteromonas aquimaris]
MTESRNSTLIKTLQHFEDIFSEGISEYRLIEMLKHEPFTLFKQHALSDSLSLFQTHFVLFNALYQLQQQWRQNRTGMLTIHTLNIKLLPYAPQGAGINLHDPLAAYYLDWNNFNGTKVGDIDKMLEDFWKRMTCRCAYSEMEIQNARDTMEIPESVTLKKAYLKQQFKRLQHQHHPDKGGDAEKSKHIVAAYDLLIKLVSD